MIRRFRFRLARLLRVREIEEEIARAEWAEAERAAARSEALSTNRRSELERSRADLERALCGGNRLDPDWTDQVHGALDRQADGLAWAHESALTRRAQSDAVAEAWREREQGRKALAELEQRRAQEHRRELERVDGREADEMALMRDAARAARRKRDRKHETDSSSPARSSD